MKLKKSRNLPLDKFINLSLYNKRYGYYMKKNPIEKKGYLKNPGYISGLFLILYSIFRFIIEFFRVPDEQLGYLILKLKKSLMIT